MTTLRLLVDIQSLQGPDPERGIPRWVSGFCRHLLADGADVHLLRAPSQPAVAHRFADLDAVAVPNDRTTFRRLTAGHRCVYVVPSPFEPVRPVESLLPTHVCDARTPVAVVMHDVGLYVFADQYLGRPGDRHVMGARRELFRRADHFLCVSAFTRTELVRVFGVPPERCTVIGAGLDPALAAAASRTDLPVPDAVRRLGRPFVMTVGRGEPRKRTDDVITAVGLLAADEPVGLAVVCRVDDHTRASWRATALAAGLPDDRLAITGEVTDDELAGAYASCAVFVEPSSYEGFGLPALEAAACGAVVLTSNAASLPEVLDEPALTFPATDPPALATLLQRALHDPQLQTLARSAGVRAVDRHRWPTVVRRALDACEAIAAPALPVPPRWLPPGTPPGAVGRTFDRAGFDAGPDAGSDAGLVGAATGHDARRPRPTSADARTLLHVRRRLARHPEQVTAIRDAAARLSTTLQAVARGDERWEPLGEPEASPLPPVRPARRGA